MLLALVSRTVITGREQSRIPMKVRAMAMLVTILISAKLSMSQSTFGNMVGVVKDPGAWTMVRVTMRQRVVMERSNS